MKKRLLAMLLAVVMVAALLPTAFAADEPSISVTVTKTDIKADVAYNYEGYGSLMIDGNWDKYEDEWYLYYDNPPADLVNPQVALVDRTGKLVFPYIETPDEYLRSRRYHYSDGIVSLTYNAYTFEGTPEYYKLDGTKAVTLKETTEEVTTEYGGTEKRTTSYVGGVMHDGYAVIAEMLSVSGDGYAGGPSPSAYKIIDKNGKVTCTLPEEFAEGIMAWEYGFSTHMSLGGWCGEGLFAFFSYYDGGMGYMDTTGKTVIDLEGRGYVDLFPFINGLAAVEDEDGMYGFIDKTGKEVIPCTYDDIDSFSSDGLCAVVLDGKCGYIDKTGKVVIPLEYDAAYGAGDGLLAVGKNGKHGLVDYDNNVVVALEYDDISSFTDGVAYAVKDGYLYIITVDEDTEDPGETETPTFTDVKESDWFYPYVQWAVENKLMTGVGGGRFDPDTSTTRLQFLVILARQAGEVIDGSDPNWAQKAIDWAVENGVSDGRNTGDPISREQMVTMLYRNAGSPPVEDTSVLDNYPDSSDLDDWAVDAMAWAVENGVVSGSGGKLNPLNGTRRSETATMLMNYIAEPQG